MIWLLDFQGHLTNSDKGTKTFIHILSYDPSYDDVCWEFMCCIWKELIIDHFEMISFITVDHVCFDFHKTFRRLWAP